MSKAKDLTPIELKEIAENYINDIRTSPREQKTANYGKIMVLEHDRPPTLLGLYRYGTKQGYSLHHYFENTNGAYDEFIGVSKHIKNLIHAELLEMALLGLIKENLASKLLGYTNDEIKLNLQARKVEDEPRVFNIEIVPPLED
jgi:hypothetical protein